MKNLAKLATAAYLAAPSGGTIYKGDTPHSGFIVGDGYQGAVCDEGTANIDETFAIVALNATADNFDGIGWWAHAGQLFIDPVSVFATESEARSIAKRNGEIAFWDIASQSEITT